MSVVSGARLYPTWSLNETLSANDDEEQDFAARLYSVCLHLLRVLCRKRPTVSALKEELGKLYLWGEAFKNGKLDQALQYSDDVLVNVLDSLGEIGELLLTGMVHRSL